MCGGEGGGRGGGGGKERRSACVAAHLTPPCDDCMRACVAPLLHALKACTHMSAALRLSSAAAAAAAAAAALSFSNSFSSTSASCCSSVKSTASPRGATRLVLPAPPDSSCWSREMTCTACVHACNVNGDAMRPCGDEDHCAARHPGPEAAQIRVHAGCV
jgi:hypothetical protein